MTISLTLYAYDVTTNHGRVMVTAVSALHALERVYRQHDDVKWAKDAVRRNRLMRLTLDVGGNH